MISPLAYVDPSAKLGNNVTVHPFAYIDKNVEIGDNNVIMPYASLMSGTRMGNGNTIYQGAVIAAVPQDFCYTGEETLVRIGDNNVIRENTSNVLMQGNTRLGSYSIVQGGCRFTKDIPPFIVAAHEPISFYSINTHVLEHEGFPETQIKHIAQAYRILYKANTSQHDALIRIKEQVPGSEYIDMIIDFVSSSKLGIIH